MHFDESKIISLKDFHLSPELQSAIGEKFSIKNRIVVLEDSPTEVKVVLTEKNFHWLPDLWKMVPRGKKVTHFNGDIVDVERVFMRSYIMH